MVDILPEIAEMLGDIAPVELAFHDGTADTPCIIRCTTLIQLT